MRLNSPPGREHQLVPRKDLSSAQVNLSRPFNAIHPDAGHRGESLGLRPVHAVERIFYTAVNDPLRGNGLPGPERR